MYLFLLLSLLSGTLELGSVILTYAEGRPLWAILSMALMYQLGNLLFLPGNYSRTMVIKSGVLNLLCQITGLWIEHTASTTTWGVSVFLCLRALQVMLSSLCIQAIRSESKSVCPTWLKRIFRIAGFILAPCLVYFPHIGMLTCAALPFVAAIFQKQHTKKEEFSTQYRTRASGKLSAVMIFHQMHYFAYTYIMPLTVIALSGNLYIGMIMYALTWIVYLLPQWLTEKRAAYDPKVVFFLCHTALALIMGTLTAAFYLENVGLGLFAWLLTGLGGGSVFCIKQLTPESKRYNIILSENIGHFLGTGVAFLAALSAKGPVGAKLTGFSCIFVLLTLAAAAIEIKYGESIKRKEHIHE